MLTKMAETSSGWLERSRDVDGALMGAALRATFSACPKQVISSPPKRKVASKVIYRKEFVPADVRQEGAKRLLADDPHADAFALGEDDLANLLDVGELDNVLETTLDV